MAHKFWEALRHSGQAQFYEESDWAAAELLVVAIDQFVTKPTALMFSSIQHGMTNLLITEGDRRRLRLELDKSEPEETSEVAELDAFRSRLAN